MFLAEKRRELVEYALRAMRQRTLERQCVAHRIDYQI